MRKEIPPFAALRAFDAAARLGGIRRAAQALGLDHAVISRHLRALEDWTATPLVDRRRSGLALTEAGRLYHQRISAAIDSIAAATLDLMKDEDDQLNIWCVPGFAAKWLLPRLSDFEQGAPHIAIEVRPTDRQPDFARHEADVTIRYAATYGQPASPPADARTLVLAEPAVVPLASPHYLAAAPPIRTVEDIRHLQLLHEESFDHWLAWFAAHGVADADIVGPRLWHAHLTVDAAIQGRGIVLANHFLAAQPRRPRPDRGHGRRRALHAAGARLLCAQCPCRPLEPVFDRALSRLAAAADSPGRTCLDGAFRAPSSTLFASYRAVSQLKGTSFRTLAEGAS